MRMNRRTFFTSKRTALAAGFAVAAALMLPLAAQETQTPPAAPAAQQDTAAPQAATAQDNATPAQASATLSNTDDKKKKKPKVAKEDRVVQSKDTRRELDKQKKLNPLVGKDASLPDKALYDKAQLQINKGHYDVARLDLQTLLNTYPDSQYQMRAKLSIADSWYREGGTAALTQAEQEYNDFITFFPNVPEAAEAQMRVGDIYLKQMDVPDRDYQKAIKAEEAYRLMLKQYPDSTLIKDARQKLREVQEVLAEREAELGAFYATHENWPASIARLQTVADTYPLYSHMDDVLVGIGDAYAAEARMMRAQNIPEGPKAKLLEIYDGKAAAAYRKVVLEHSASEHVEDAKERLVSMNLPIPTPTPEQAAASEELEGSRARYTFQARMRVLLMRRPDTVNTARTGDAPLDDAAATNAPAVTAELVGAYKNAFNPAAAAPTPARTELPATADTPAPAPAAAPATSAPLALQDVAGPGEGSAGTDTSNMTVAAPAATGAAGNSVGVEVLTPGVTATGTAADTPNGLRAVGPANTSAVPAIEKPAEAPDQVNEVAGKPQPPVPAVTATGKKTPKPGFDKDDESSSKHKKKKGLAKLNPL
jgi:outer membrane protein assembly factor BamD